MYYRIALMSFLCRFPLGLMLEGGAVVVTYWYLHNTLLRLV